MLRLINQILDLSKLETGKGRLNCEQGDLISFIKGTTMSFSTIAQRKKINLHFESNTQEISTYFDRDVIEKIFYNLLSNAFKFTNKGGCVEVIINHPAVENGKTFPNNTCKISVKDSGIGIPDGELSKVFNKFYTVENINGFTEQGSGIGLALVKELVEHHKGKITVESKINEGSVFTVSLPVGIDFFNEHEIAKDRTDDKFISGAIGASGWRHPPPNDHGEVLSVEGVWTRPTDSGR